MTTHELILVNPRAGLSLPAAFSERRVESLLAARTIHPPLGVRDRAMLELTYASGLRVSEIVSLPRDRVDLQAGVLRVTGKGGTRESHRFGSLGGALAAPVSGTGATSLDRRRSAALFLSIRSGPMTRRRSLAACRGYGRAARIRTR